MNLLKKIVSFGLSGIEVYHQKRAIALCNYISLILASVLSVLFIVRWTFFSENPHGITTNYFLMGTVLFLIPIFLNKIGLTTISRLFTCYSPIFFVWFLFLSLIPSLPSIEPTTFDTMRIFLLVFSFMPYLLFDKSNIPLLLLAILPSLLSFLFFEPILTSFNFNHQLEGFAKQDYQLMPMRTFMAYIIVSAACYTFQTIISLSDQYNRKILLELQSKTDEIEAQNEELIQSQDKLNEVNIHLEDLVNKKTQSIKEQNEVLLKYAHANAHHVRGPVARLLGLIQLSKMETDLKYPILFEKIENEANEMDQVIKGISDELNSISDET